MRKYFEKVVAENALVRPNWGVVVLNVGHNLHPARTPYPDHGHPGDYYFDWQKGRTLNEFQLVYIAQGQGSFESTGNQSTIVEAGTVFLLFPGVWHRFQPSKETGWEEFWVGFKGPYAEYLMTQTCIKPEAPLLNIGFNTEFFHIFSRLVDTVRYEDTNFQELTSCLTIQLLSLVYASSLTVDSTQNRRKQLIDRARFRIHEHEEQAIDMQELARELHVSYAWFRREFKEILGIAPGQYHLELRLNRARQLLRETTLSVGQIAAQTGFGSEFYFSRIFKNKTGIPPLQFRNAHVLAK